MTKTIAKHNSTATAGRLQSLLSSLNKTFGNLKVMTAHKNDHKPKAVESRVQRTIMPPNTFAGAGTRPLMIKQPSTTSRANRREQIGTLLSNSSANFRVDAQPNVSGTVGAHTFVYPFTPRTLLTTMLYTQGIIYKKWRPKSDLIVEYVPNISEFNTNGAVGEVVISYNPDANSPSPILPLAAQNFLSTSGLPSVPLTLRIPWKNMRNNQDWLYCDDLGGDEPRREVCGFVQIASHSCNASEISIGRIFVTYDIEFAEPEFPQWQPISVPGAYAPNLYNSVWWGLTSDSNNLTSGSDNLMIQDSSTFNINQVVPMYDFDTGQTVSNDIEGRLYTGSTAQFGSFEIFGPTVFRLEGVIHFHTSTAFTNVSVKVYRDATFMGTIYISSPVAAAGITDLSAPLSATFFNPATASLTEAHQWLLKVNCTTSGAVAYTIRGKSNNLFSQWGVTILN
jgi:hypothetical protein